MDQTPRTTGITSTSVSTTRPDLSPLPAENKLWREIKEVTVRTTLLISIFAPILVSGQYLYYSSTTTPVVPAVTSPRIPAPFVNPDIIITVAPPQTQTRVETETTTVAPIPPDQRRTTPKHRAPEETPAPAVTTPPRTRRVAPPTTSSPPPPPSAPASSSVTASSTPIYDSLRNETLANDPNLETVIPE